MKIIFTLLSMLLICNLVWIGLTLHNQEKTNAKIVYIEEQKLTIEQERHVDSLYSIYQENMSICKKNASEQGKDESYIKENCVNVINDSIIASWLKSRGYSNLIKE